ncbi:MAG: peptidoglycan-binding protein [Clostridiales bacterium]|nr:peptidoglycan-binding protein [Clostridiales bacterium]
MENNKDNAKDPRRVIARVEAKRQAKAKQEEKKRRQLMMIAAAALAVVVIAVILIIALSSGGSKTPDVTDPTDPGTEIVTTAPTDVVTEPTAEPTPGPTAQPEVYLPIVTKGPTTGKRIAITIQYANEPNVLNEIMTIAETSKAQLTVFVTGKMAVEKDDIRVALRRANDLNFELENFTYDNYKLFSLSDADLAFQIYQTQKAVNLALGVDYNMHFLRIYEGLAQNDLRTHQYLVQLGNYKGIASFNVDGNEKAQTLKKLQSGLKSGNIYAFNCNADSVAKLKEFIPYAVSKGYELVTLNDLLGYEKNEVTALEGEAMDALIPEPLPFVYQNYVLLGGKERPQGYAVQLLQQRLIELGYLSKDSRVDGDYGPNTKLAVQLFQQQMGLSTDGYAGVETQKLLFSEDAEPNRGTRVAGQN